MKPKLFKHDGYWYCVCNRGLRGIGWHIQTAYQNWARQAGARC